MREGSPPPGRWWLGVRLVLGAVTAMVGLTMAAAGALLLGLVLALLGAWWVASGIRQV